MKKKILVVEDSMINRLMLQRFLEVNNFQVQVASNGIDAIDQINTDNLPDIIVTDLKMPYMDGYQFLKVLRENTITRKLPIIAISAFDLLSEEELQGHTFDLCILKPFSLDHLRNDILQLIDGYAECIQSN
ncbi:response regulator [Algoriphagus winogradskyi]|uniref:Response regulator receiver protein n=1 Tax=Algoriphagus winogradskyi TaxID=237017 RepID=A0ABY1PFV7_9BACT|nr:response regulator [Algoriphagus winogradskyi]SMP33294.1 response regulator receiver protein [Algoriphagus winogradskyi]